MTVSPHARRLALLGSAGLGLLVAYALGRPNSSGISRPTGPVPVAHLPAFPPADDVPVDPLNSGDPDLAASASADDRTAQGAPPRVEEIPCDVPGVAAVPEFRVALHRDINQTASGGTIPPGRYRLTSAQTEDEKRTDGLWTLLLDFASDGQGAMYRHLGLRTLGSRMSYQTAGGRLSLKTVCPDIQATGMTFFYSLLPTGLTLMTEDGVVLTMERFADSQVEGLPPPRALPSDKVHLPPR